MEQGNSALAVDDDSEYDDGVDDDEDDAGDDEILPTDSLILTAVTEDEFSHIEVQVLSEDGSLYLHHDITLPDFPLCMAWLDCPPFLQNSLSESGETVQQMIGNYVAVGTFSPAIEIWNLDVLDPLEPSATLGGPLDPADESIKKKKKGKKSSLVSGSHTDAVMSLSWNKDFRQALASGSADKTVKIWDVTTQKCNHTFKHHSDKVIYLNE